MKSAGFRRDCWWHNSPPMHDYIIVGAGSAGCVLANRLTEDPAVRVLLLEAGGPDKRVEIQIPAAFAKLFKTDCDWSYSTEPQTELHGRTIFWPRGKVLGGSSSINAMVYSRANRGDHDGWAALGIQGWTYSDILPYYRKSERNERWSNEFHSADGPWHVAEPRCLSPLTRVFIDGAKATGIRETADFNGAAQEGVGYFQVNQKDGKRHSAAAAFLKPAMSRPNLEIKTGAHISRVLFESTRATGVEYIDRGKAAQVGAQREVILCGGTVNSPQVLMLSGIGPADRLRTHGIPAFDDLPGVGQNLQDHPLVGVEFECREPITLDKADSIRNLLRYLVFKQGPLTSNVCEGAAFVKIDGSSPVPDIEIAFAPAFYMNNGWDNPKLYGFAAGVVLQHPESRGEIRLRSADPLAPPIIQPNYYSSSRDMQVSIAGLKLAREILRSGPFDRYRGKEWWPESDAKIDADWIEHVRRTSQTIYHPVGTCRMGTSRDPMAVVDEELRVRGVTGLRVVDASVFPSETTGHTNAPVIALAERAADVIRGRVAIAATSTSRRDVPATV
jgi:choline dehydrogenase